MGEDYVLSIVVGTLNRLDRIRECIKSIQQDASFPIKIYVTDAGSTDGTVEYLKEIESENITVILHKKKLGQAKAYNEIFEIIQTPYVCWLSDDNKIINHGLETAVQILDSNPTIGMVGLKVKDVQGPFMAEPYVGGLSELGILNVNQGVLRTELLQSLGGFSEDFMDYGIDPDLTAKVLYAGNDIVYTKDVAILHWRDWGESAVLDAQMEKQSSYKALYREKYSCDNLQIYPGRLSFWFISRLKSVANVLFWKLGLTRAGWVRDWYNVLLGRYINIFDPIRSMGKKYHLLQHCDPETVKYFSERLDRKY